MFIIHRSYSYLSSLHTFYHDVGGLKFLRTTYRNTDTIGGPFQTCVNRVQGPKKTKERTRTMRHRTSSPYIPWDNSTKEKSHGRAGN